MTGNRFDEMRAAVEEAKDTLRAADGVADSLASLLCGRLRHVKPWLLRALKRELAEFNAATGEWKS